MSKLRRIGSVFSALLMLLCSLIILMDPKDGYAVVILFLDITLLMYGLRLLIYYFTMARFMVGGIMTLYKSIIVIDFGLFVFTMDQLPEQLSMLYLTGLMLFNGILGLLRAVDAKRVQASFWKNRMAYGMVLILLAVYCLFWLHSVQMVSIIYSLGLIHSAIYRIVEAFKKSAIIYIE